MNRPWVVYNPNRITAKKKQAVENKKEMCNSTHLSKKLDELRIGFFTFSGDLEDMPLARKLFLVSENEFKEVLATFRPLLNTILHWLLPSADVTSVVSFLSALGEAWLLELIPSDWFVDFLMLSRRILCFSTFKMLWIHNIKNSQG